MLHGWLLRCDPAEGRLDVELGEGAARADSADGSVTLGAGHPTSSAVWDAPARTLRLVRDRTGQHPLFHARAGGMVVASTDARALLREPTVSREPSAVAVAELLLERPGPPDETLVAALRRLPAGHVLMASPDGVRVSRAWEPPPAGTLPAGAADRLGALLEAAVCAGLDGRAGVFLSGGIDSTAVAAAAAAASAARGLPAPLAMCADIEGSSEAKIQRAVADGLGLERIERRYSATERAVELALAASRGALWPVESAWGAVFHGLLADAHAAGCTVLLDGAGGDELLDAGLAPARALLRRGRLGALRDLAEAERLYAGGSLLHVLRAALGRARPPCPEPVPGWVADPALRRELDERATQPPPDDHLLDTFLAASAEVAADTAFAGSYRHLRPFFDPAVVELVRGLPPEALVRGGDPKSPARAYVCVRIPSLPGRWPRPAVVGPLLDQVVAAGSASAWRALGGPQRLDTLGLRIPREPAGDFDFGLDWTMLSMEQWLRHIGGGAWRQS